MKHMIRLTNHTATDIMDIFHIADEIRQGKHADILKGKSIVMFFPETSIRTRVTFEKGISLLGGQPILFPPEALDKKEALQDVCGYLSLWANALIVRHKDIRLLEKLAQHSDIPMINAMTDSNHPCEIIADMYALSKRRKDFLKDSYLFCGENGNIGLAWKEASLVMGFDLSQCCPKGWEMEHITAFDTITEAIRGKDIICTDSLPPDAPAAFKNCQVTRAVMEMANKGALLNPCPPFSRGGEVSADALDSEYFVGYEFKKHLLEVQQAILIYCLTR